MGHDQFDRCYRCVECGRHYHNYEGADFCQRNDAELLAKSLLYPTKES
jgi:hypothetical protein